LSYAEEAAILKEFDEKVAEGRVVTVSEIKKAFDEKRGKDTGRGYIYMLLKRHEYRMVMPRSKHPKKASDEEIESSKKLT
jgi:transposase